MSGRVNYDDYDDEEMIGKQTWNCVAIKASLVF